MANSKTKINNNSKNATLCPATSPSFGRDKIRQQHHHPPMPLLLSSTLDGIYSMLKTSFQTYFFHIEYETSLHKSSKESWKLTAEKGTTEAFST